MGDVDISYGGNGKESGGSGLPVQVLRTLVGSHYSSHRLCSVAPTGLIMTLHDHGGYTPTGVDTPAYVVSP